MHPLPHSPTRNRASTPVLLNPHAVPFMAPPNPKTKFPCHKCGFGADTYRNLQAHIFGNHNNNSTADSTLPTSETVLPSSEQEDMDQSIKRPHHHEISVKIIDSEEAGFGNTEDVESVVSGTDGDIHVLPMEKPFQCAVCQETFRKPDDVSNHLENHNNGESAIALMQKLYELEKSWMKEHDMAALLVSFLAVSLMFVSLNKLEVQGPMGLYF